MIKEIIKSYLGKQLWNIIVKKYDINYNKVVIVLPEDNDEWNRTALKYLPNYMQRKSVEEAVIIVDNNKKNIEKNKIKCNVVKLSSYAIRLLMQYYCFYRFFDNIVFFYLNYPRDNLTKLVLEQGNITMDEWICLGFYKLREVPNNV